LPGKWETPAEKATSGFGYKDEQDCSKQKFRPVIIP